MNKGINRQGGRVAVLHYPKYHNEIKEEMKMTVHDVKIGDDYKELGRKLAKDSCKPNALNLCKLPSFMCSEYIKLYNMDNEKEAVYIKVKDGVIVDIRHCMNEVYNEDVARANMEEILNNNV